MGIILDDSTLWYDHMDIKNARNGNTSEKLQTLEVMDQFVISENFYSKSVHLLPPAIYCSTGTVHKIRERKGRGEVAGLAGGVLGRLGGAVAGPWSRPGRERPDDSSPWGVVADMVVGRSRR